MAGFWKHRRMLLSFFYLAFLVVLRLLVWRRRGEFATDVELLVLRHQLVVLGRQQTRPPLQAAEIARSSRRSPGCSRPDADTG
jgi:hypothetical protein